MNHPHHAILIIRKTLQGAVPAWNLGAEKVFGYSPAEAVGQPMTLLLPPGRTEEESDILARVARGKSVNHFDTVRVPKPGTKIDVSVAISPVIDSRGAIVGRVKNCSRHQPRKQAERKRRCARARNDCLRQLDSWLTDAKVERHPAEISRLSSQRT